jgi:Protein of unknown function (DUF1822)
MDLTFARDTEWWLEVAPDIQVESWRQSERNATTSNLWNTYLNSICLNAVLASIQAELGIEADVWLENTNLYALWEFVNGTAITIGDTRLILIPSEAIDDGELLVPKEWVDIPSWVGDYYLAIEVSSDAHWVRIWGYTTHQQLKTNGSYDDRDRMYSMDGSLLKQDLNAFWVICQLCTEEQTRAEVEAIVELPDNQVEDLIQRLGQSSVIFPRLTVPFSRWGALMEREERRQHLYQMRLRGESVLVNLSQWFQQTFEAAWQPLEMLLSPNFRFERGVRQEVAVERAKLIDLGIQLENQSVVLLVAITSETEQRVSVQVRLYPSQGNIFLPRYIKLALLSPSREILQEIMAREQDNYVQTRFRGRVGENFSIQVALNEAEIIEDFVI